MARRILIVEDHKEIADLLALHLRDLPCEVLSVQDGNEGMAAAESKSFDLVILDLMLPGVGGLEILKRLRARANYTPVLVLTSKTSEIDRVLGLELGADDYVTKPFSITELTARVKAIFRRVDALTQQAGEPAGPIRAGALEIDVERRSVTLAGTVVELTAKEFDLLLFFARNPGRVFTRGQLLDKVWGYSHSGYEHTVNSHINRLRAKIEQDPAKPLYLLTVWSVGYKFSESLASAASGL
jgi:DNA-binding response OmpR family regulator